MRKWWALVVLALSVSLIVIDGTIVNVALPTIIADLKLSFTATQWVVTLYALIFAALLLTSGRLGDRVGRRLMLIVGVTLFVAASVLAGLAHGSGLFLLARAVQGVGAAMVLPSTLSTVNATFRGRDRAIAFGVWGATIAAMAAVGPLLGGWLTSDIDWRWIFWINVPLGVAIIVGALLVVPESRGSRRPAGVDLAGLLLSILGFGALVFGLVQGSAYGWWRPKRALAIGPVTWPETAPVAVSPIAILVGLVGLAGFVLAELRRLRAGREPLLDVTLFRFRSFRWGNVAALLIALGEFGLLFVLPLYLQNVLGMSAIASGWVLAAMALGAFLAGGSAGGLSRRLPASRIAQVGVVLEAVGVAVLALSVRAHTPTWQIVTWLVVYGIGLGLCSAQLTSVILQDVPPELSGQGSATQSTTRQVGSALGVAVLSSVLGQVLHDRTPGALGAVALLPDARARLASGFVDSAGGLLGALKEGRPPLPPAVARQVIATLADVFASATRVTMLAGAAALAVAFVVTLRLPLTNTRHEQTRVAE